MPFASTHLPSTVGEPELMNTGRGAHNATNSCASKGKSFGVSGPAYLIKFPANQWYSPDDARFSTCSPKTRRRVFVPPAPDEPTNAIAKRGSYAMVTIVALPYLDKPSIPTRLASTALSVSK